MAGTRIGSDGKSRGKGRDPTPETDCLTPGCPRKFGGNQEKKGGRGLCHYCHNVASNLVKKGATTWDQLEEMGLANPPHKTLFEKAFKAKRKEMRCSSSEPHSVTGSAGLESSARSEPSPESDGQAGSNDGGGSSPQ